jgi:hypothetical protein
VVDGAQPYVFVSYSRADVDYVQSLAGFLADRGIRVVLERRRSSAVPGRAELVRTRIAGATAVVLVDSPAARGSRWVEKEIAYDQDVVPVLVLSRHGDPGLLAPNVSAESVIGEAMPSDSFVGHLSNLFASSGPRAAAVRPPTPGQRGRPATVRRRALVVAGITAAAIAVMVAAVVVALLGRDRAAEGGGQPPGGSVPGGTAILGAASLGASGAAGSSSPGTAGGSPVPGGGNGPGGGSASPPSSRPPGQSQPPPSGPAATPTVPPPAGNEYNLHGGDSVDIDPAMASEISTWMALAATSV